MAHLPSGIFNTTYRQDRAIFRTWDHWIWIIGFVIVMATFPAFMSRYYLSILIHIFCAIIAVHGLNLLTGYCGLLSLGHASFVAAGAYCAGVLANTLEIHFLIAIPLGGIFSGLIGLLFGAPSLRVKGFYLAVTTLGAQFIIIYAISHMGITGGVRSLDLPSVSLFGILLDTDYSYYYVALIAVIIATYLVKNITRTGVGRALIAIRDNDLAAEAMGINLFYYKMIAFFLGCFFAGISGAVYAFYLQTINIEYFTLMDSVWYLGMIVIGGMGTVLGGILGVIFIIILREFIISFAPMMIGFFPNLGIEFSAAMSLLVMGFIIMFFLVFEPKGLAHRWEIIKSKFRLYPFPY